MATLFFEGFNVKNTDGVSTYLDDRYWTRPVDPFYPRLFHSESAPDNDIRFSATYGYINISGYFLDTNPVQFTTPLQLSGIPNLNSDKLYVSFRVKGLSYNDTINNSFPYTSKFLTFCDGNNESLSIETVKITGASIQGGTWESPQDSIGLSIKQSGNEIGLFDLRVEGLTEYMLKFYGSNQAMAITKLSANYDTRFIHLEFLIDKLTNTVSARLEGLDILNRLTSYPYLNYASGQNIGSINNLKFYNKGYKTFQDNYAGLFTVFGVEKYMSIDDLVICNNSGYDPKMWVGPKTRIYHLRPDIGRTPFRKNDWLPATPAGANQDRYILNSRDGDNSFKYSETSGSIISMPLIDYRILISGSISNYIENGIGGVRVFNDVRKTFLDSDFINVYGTGDISQSGNYIEIGDKYTVTKTNYGIKNSFVMNDPVTSLPWTSGTFFRPRDLPLEDCGGNDGFGNLNLCNMGGNNASTTSGVFGLKKL